MTRSIEDKSWAVYIVECADGTLYTGISNNVTERIAKHNAGKGARYTRSRRPVVLGAFWSYLSKSDAAKAEYALKAMKRDQKLKLIEDHRAGKKSDCIPAGVK